MLLELSPAWLVLQKGNLVADLSSIKTKAIQFGEDFFIRFYLQTNRDEIVSRFRKFLDKYSTAEFSKIIDEGRPLPPPDEVISLLRDYKMHVLRMRPDEILTWVVEWITEARPDIGNVLVTKGQAASLWLAAEAKLFFDVAYGSAGQVSSEMKVEFSKATCDNCHKSWLVEKNDASVIRACPFCGQAQVVEGIDEGKEGTQAQS